VVELLIQSASEAGSSPAVLLFLAGVNDVGSPI
jgi:hypothetical protein